MSYRVDYYDDQKYDVPSWTRWTRTADANGNYHGSPFASIVFTDCGLSEGNPNGINDGVVMLFASGQD